MVEQKEDLVHYSVKLDDKENLILSIEKGDESYTILTIDEHGFMIRNKKLPEGLGLKLNQYGQIKVLV